MTTDAPGKRPGAWPVATATLGLFLVVLAVLAVQVRNGSDPVLGGGQAPPKRVVVRRIVRRVVVTRVVPSAVAAEAAPPTASASVRPAAPAPAPAPVTRSS